MKGPLKNARHEKFAQGIAKGERASSAYKNAGYSATGNAAEAAASRLLKHAKVAARVRELAERRSEKVLEKTAVDAAWVLKKAVDLHDKALEDKVYAAAKGALELIGKHVDVRAFREHVEHSGLIEYRDLSDEEIAARIAAHEEERAGRSTTH